MTESYRRPINFNIIFDQCRKIDAKVLKLGDGACIYRGNKNQKS